MRVTNIIVSNCFFPADHEYFDLQSICIFSFQGLLFETNAVISSDVEEHCETSLLLLFLSFEEKSIRSKSPHSIKLLFSATNDAYQTICM
jgi:hypothetical protein